MNNPIFFYKISLLTTKSVTITYLLSYLYIKIPCDKVSQGI